MSQINSDVYPAATTALKGMTVCEYNLDHYLDETEWDTSLAISQSTSANAPFNRITNFVPYNGNIYVKQFNRQYQKIGLVYIGTGYGFGRYQYTSWNYSAAVMNSVVSSYWYTRSLGKTMRSGAVISQIQSHYQPNKYELVIGLKLKDVLGVICVLLRGPGVMKWCSLKYYNDNKQNITETPCGLFMNIYYGDIENPVETANTRRCFAPLDLTTNDVFNWRLNNGSLNEETTPGFASLFPPAVFRGITYYETGTQTNPFKEDFTGNASIIAPLVGCMNGAAYLANENNWQNITTQAGTIYGGVINEDFTLNLASGSVSLTLTQAAFDRAFSTAATYGIPFSDDFPDSPTTLFTSDNTTYMPTANDGGYYDGQFTTLTIAGEEQELPPNEDSIWNNPDPNAPWNGRPYNPDAPIPVDDIPLTTPTLTSAGAFYTSYIISGSDLKQLARFLNNPDSDIMESLVQNLKLYGNNPMNAFISLMLFPLDIRQTTGASKTSQMVVGRISVDDPSTSKPLTCYKLPANAMGLLELGAFEIKKKFNCFLDYEPYTTIQLYIPYCGSVDLQPSLVVGHKIKAQMAVDWLTGACAAVISVSTTDGYKPILFKEGSMGQSIGMTASSYSQNTASAAIKGGLGAIQGILGIAQVATGNPAGFKSLGDGFTNLVQAQNKWKETDFQKCGSNSPGASNFFPKYCYLTISYPIPKLKNFDQLYIYSRTTGFATVENTTLQTLKDNSRFYGIRQANLMGNLIYDYPVPSFLNVMPTTEEIETIKRILNEGFEIRSS